MMALGLLILRVVVGLLFVGHGTQKLFGWFGGHGLSGTGGFLESLGYHPGRPHASLAGIAEAGGGALLTFGFFTPIACAAIIGVMVNAIMAVHGPNGVWNTEGGYEYPLVLIAAVAAVAFVGPGAASIDHLVGIDLDGFGWGLATLVVGIVTGVLLASTRRPPAPATAVAGPATATPAEAPTPSRR